MITNEAEFLTVREAADLLRVSRPTIWRWIDAGRLPAVRLGPRSIRVRRADLRRLEQHARVGRRDDRLSICTIQLGDATVAEDELMARLQSIQAAMLAERGGTPFGPSAGLIGEARRERDGRA